MSDDLLISTKDLCVEFKIGGGIFNKKVLKAVDGISIDISPADRSSASWAKAVRARPRWAGRC